MDLLRKIAAVRCNIRLRDIVEPTRQQCRVECNYIEAAAEQLYLAKLAEYNEKSKKIDDQVKQIQKCGLSIGEWMANGKNAELQKYVKSQVLADLPEPPKVKTSELQRIMQAKLKQKSEDFQSQLDFLQDKTKFYERSPSPRTDVLSPLFRKYDEKLDERLQLQQIGQESLQSRMAKSLALVEIKHYEAKKFDRNRQEQQAIPHEVKSTNNKSPRRVVIRDDAYFKQKLDRMREHMQDQQDKTLQSIEKGNRQTQKLMEMKQKW